MDAGDTKSHGRREVPSIRLSEAIVLTSGVALLAAVGLVLIRAGDAVGGTKAYVIAPDHQASMLTQEAVSLHLVGEKEDRPGVSGARSEKRLAAVIPIFEEILAVAV